MALSRQRAIGFVAALAGAVALSPLVARDVDAAGEARTISFYHIHTKETLTVTYKKGGQFVPEALEKINWILRDWRKNEATKMDPNTIDIVWEMHQELGSREPVHIISGYRSRRTNEMLRKTRGGQATQSQHMTGKAIDVSFPDVPVRRMRYSAMIRERGGVGYYPTSGIPFVHVDTARVRHWPRMLRDELALIFPNGRSKHHPADGRPISPADVTAARSRNKALATEVAQFFEERGRPKSAIQVASADGFAPAAPKPKPASRPLKAEQRMAVGAPLPPTPSPKAPIAEPAPRLVQAPQLADRSSRFKPVDRADRARLDELVTLASLDAKPKEKAAPAIVTASLGPSLRPAKIKESPAQPRASEAPTNILADSLYEAAHRSAWIAAPDFDDDHPEEMTYRPFPILPLMTETPSFDDPALAQLVHPDAAKALALIDDEGGVPPMRLGPSRQTATLLWAQEFSGAAVSLVESTPPALEAGQMQVASRSVRTIGQ